MAETPVPTNLRAVPEIADSPDNRMPAAPPDEWTEDQKAAAAEFEALRGVKPGGPFIPLLRAPEVFRFANRMGNYLRFNTELPMVLSELAILITARRWTQNYEWIAHRKIAEEAGLAPATCQAIKEGRRPAGMSDDEETVYEMCTELHRNGEVSDVTYARAKHAFGERGVIDLAAICGYYSTLAMIMNVARTPPPAGADPELEGFRG
jgi:4-carboxymuconolactone decarboxylase